MVTIDCDDEVVASNLDSFKFTSYIDQFNIYLEDEEIEIEEVEASDPDNGLIIKPSDFEGLEWNIKIKFGDIAYNQTLSEYDLEDAHVFLSMDSTFSGDITKYWVGKTSNSFLRAEDFEKQEFLPLKDGTSYFWFIASFDKKTNELLYISPIWKFHTEPLLSIDVFKNDFDFNVSPNPVRNQLKLSFNLQFESDIILEIYDVNMRKLQEVSLGRRNLGPQEETISSSFLSNGIYFIVLNQQSINGKSYKSIKKIIKY
jgi:hypothetical protein